MNRNAARGGQDECGSHDLGAAGVIDLDLLVSRQPLDPSIALLAALYDSYNRLGSR
jgi:hypothetical protein